MSQHTALCTCRYCRIKDLEEERGDFLTEFGAEPDDELDYSALNDFPEIDEEIDKPEPEELLLENDSIF